MHKPLRYLLAGATMLLLVGAGCGRFQLSGSATNPPTPAQPSAGAQETIDVSAMVDAAVASAKEEKVGLEGAETDTQVIEETDTEINAYGNIYDQSELN